MIQKFLISALILSTFTAFSQGKVILTGDPPIVTEHRGGLAAKTVMQVPEDSAPHVLPNVELKRRIRFNPVTEKFEGHNGTEWAELGYDQQLKDAVNYLTAGFPNKADLVGGKVPLSQINDALIGAVNYQGTYNATTNTPALPSASANKGKYWVVNVEGTQQSENYKVGDWVISNGVVWGRVPKATDVDSTPTPGSNNAVSSGGVSIALATKANATDVTAGLATKQATLVSGSNIKTIEGQTLVGSGNIDLTKNDIGLPLVDNTSDLSKPISTATQTAINSKANATGTNATGTWPINVTGNSGNSLLWNSLPINLSNVSTNMDYLVGVSSNSGVLLPASVVKSWLSTAITDVSGLAASLAGKANLEGGNAFTGNQTIFSTLSVSDAPQGNSMKISRNGYGCLFGNSSTEDGIILYNLAGNAVYQRWHGSGNVSINSSIDNGETFQVNGTGSFNGEVTAANATSLRSLVNLGQLGVQPGDSHDKGYLKSMTFIGDGSGSYQDNDLKGGKLKYIIYFRHSGSTYSPMFLDSTAYSFNSTSGVITYTMDTPSYIVVNYVK